MLRLPFFGFSSPWIYPVLLAATQQDRFKFPLDKRLEEMRGDEARMARTERSERFNVSGDETLPETARQKGAPVGGGVRKRLNSILQNALSGEISISALVPKKVAGIEQKQAHFGEMERLGSRARRHPGLARVVQVIRFDIFINSSITFWSTRGPAEDASRNVFVLDWEEGRKETCGMTVVSCQFEVSSDVTSECRPRRYSAFRSNLGSG